MNKSRPIRLRQALFSLPFGLLFLLGSMVFVSPSWAWGDLGHKIICQIAFEELNDKARNEVIRLIVLDAAFDSLADKTITTTGCHGVPKCLFTAIPLDSDVLTAVLH